MKNFKLFVLVPTFFVLLIFLGIFAGKPFTTTAPAPAPTPPPTPTPPRPAVGTVNADPTTTDMADFVCFVKQFHEQMTTDVELRVSEKQCSFGSSYTYELRQSNGAWVDFDCNDVAARILDRSLVPITERECVALRGAVDDWWKANPDPTEYVDGEGRVWRRQETAPAETKGKHDD